MVINKQRRKTKEILAMSSTERENSQKTSSLSSELEFSIKEEATRVQEHAIGAHQGEAEAADEDSERAEVFEDPDGISSDILAQRNEKKYNILKIITAILIFLEV